MKCVGNFIRDLFEMNFEKRNKQTNQYYISIKINEDANL